MTSSQTARWCIWILWHRGGFPEGFLAKNDGDSLGWRLNFIRTYLERDIPQLGPRIPDEETLKQKVNAIETSRNQTRSSIDCQFTTDDARIKLKRLYPSIPD